MNAIVDKPVALPPVTQSPIRRPRRRLGRILRPAIGIAALLAVTVTASWWFTEGRWIESTDDAYVQGDIATLSPRIDGDIASVPVADNQFVHAGDPLILLDPSDWKAKLA